LLKVCEFSANDKFTLLYRGTRDGFGENDFHSKCDGHSNTLTLFKAKESSFIFGGFTSVSCKLPGTSMVKSKLDANAFIFSLANKDNEPIKMNSNRLQFAIRCNPEYCPTFGADIYVANTANTTMDNYSNLGLTYSHPQYAHGASEAQTFLAEPYNFQLDKIEVFQKEI
jgi:hypothetical protein